MTAKLKLLVLLVTLQLSATGSNDVGLLDLFDLSLANSCNETEYYDSSKLSCQKCPDNSVPVVKKDKCRCKEDYYFMTNNGGGSIECAVCPQNLIQSLDGSTCVKCDEACRNCTNTNGFLVEYGQDGNSLRDADGNLMRMCITCNTTNSFQTSSSCISCKTNLFSEDSTKINLNQTSCDEISLSGGMFLTTSTEPASLPNQFTAHFDTEPFSWFLSQYLVGTYRTCILQSNRNSTSCEVLANMCVLNLYQSDPNKFSVCKAHFEADQPILKYSESYNNYLSRYIESGIQNNFIKMQPLNARTLYVAEYDLNGKLQSFKESNLAKFQQCNILQLNEAEAQKTCTISVGTLLKYFGTKNAVFYELYIKVGDDNIKLSPIPVRIANNERQDGQVLYKRFFLIDAISSKKDLNSVPAFIRYAKTISIQFELIPSESNGVIYPPVMVIEYGTVETGNGSLSVDMRFDAEYRMNYKKQSDNLWIAMGCLFFVALVWTFLRTWNWNKRAGKFACDIVSLFKFISFFITGIGNCFWLGMVATSLFYFIVYHNQTETVIFLPMRNQEKNIRALVVTAFALKLFDVLNLIFVQTSYDIFFIDWERPRAVKSHQSVYPLQTLNKKKKLINVQGNNNQRSLQHDYEASELEKQNAVSGWRKLFVANEWNELQTTRKLRLDIQVCAILLFLVYLDFEKYAVKKEDGEYSRVLRLAIGSLVYLIAGIVQWIFYTFFYSRLISDRIGKFIDFCSISNISIFILTHNQFGYYIHGKSPHGTTDVSIPKIIQSLIKEADNLMTTRGLEPNSNHQTFSILTTYKLSSQYGKAMRPLIEKNVRRAVKDEIDQDIYEKKFASYTQLNRFLMAFIEKISRDIPYDVTRRNLIENILNVEIKSNTDMTYFYKDDEACFTDTIFFGSERKLFTFELTFFLFIDYFAENYAFAAFILVMAHCVLERLRSDLGARNLARKTLVDKRFLL